MNRAAFMEASRELAEELGQITPRRISPTRWAFTADTDKSERDHFVDLIGGNLYCSCVGYVIHKTRCKHIDSVKRYEGMNDNEYPLTSAVAVATPNFGAVEVHRTPGELQTRLNEMRQERGLVAQFFKDVMEPSHPGKADGDYGIIPGTDKPTLLKPGAEKLCELYGYAPTIKNREETIDHASGHYRCVVTMALIQKGSGAVVAEGVGECNTREARYFYRWVWDKDVPPGMDKNALKKRSGTSQKNGRPWTQYRLENDDLFSLWNTVLKMAKKRALVDAVLSATRSSGIFSQSMEEINDWIEADYEVMAEEPPETPATADAPTATAPAAPSQDEVTLAYIDLVNARGADAGKAAMAWAVERWPEAKSAKGIDKTKLAPDALQELIAEMRRYARTGVQRCPGEEHSASTDEATTLLTCGVCGLVLETPDESTEAQQTALPV